jgi:hypothetical protein
VIEAPPIFAHISLLACVQMIWGERRDALEACEIQRWQLGKEPGEKR